MQCHWGWGRAGLLDYEITHLRSLDFFQFDTAPGSILLAQRPPLSAVGSRVSRLERGDSLVWLDGRGGGTGYPWAIALTRKGAALRYATTGGRVMAFDLGLARGSVGDAALAVLLDGRAVGLYQVTAGHPPQRIVLETRSAREVAFRLARRQGQGPLVLGNPRLYR